MMLTQAEVQDHSSACSTKVRAAGMHWRSGLRALQCIDTKMHSCDMPALGSQLHSIALQSYENMCVMLRNTR
jgi:hypothetical protein